MRISRREFLAASAAPFVLKAQKRPQLAGVITEHRYLSHGQHIVDRFLEGYGWNGTHHHPPMDLVALYVDQHPKGDLVPDRAARFPTMKVYPTIAEALTRGTSKLAVDGVVVVGEHGHYPRNEKGQTKYPRYEFFQQIVKVFRESGRSVPVFNDKHLSWNWDWAKEMYDTSRSMGFPFMAGSSLPVTWRTPSLEMPPGKVREAMCDRLRRRRQLRFPRPRDHPVHGGAASRRREWRQVGAGLSRRQFLEGARGGRLAAATCSRPPSAAATPCKPAREGFNDIFPSVDDHAPAGHRNRSPIATSTPTA